MRLSTFILRRTGLIVFSLVGLSILVFVLARVLPGDPARAAAGNNAPQWAVDQLRRQLGLDKPLYTQYFVWLDNVLHGDLGYSLTTKRDITADVIQYLPASLELIVLAAMFQIAGSFILGIIAGRYSYKAPDNLVRVVSYIGISIPAFVLAIILQLVFSWYFKLFPTTGELSAGIAGPPAITGSVTVDSLIAGKFDVLANALWHMVLPALALCMGAMCQDARIIRSGMVENKDKDYISMAKSQGLPDRTVTLKYLLKPSLIPAVTVMGLDIAALMANAFLVEQVFNWPGFANLGLTFMLNKDLNGIVALVLIIGIMYAVANIVVDVIVAYLDPRIRLMERGQ
ncbi:MAG: ABC transporter permease [Candidatus Bathyarchaeia archaeon]|jgi:peptide/nickel transport system permease protein